MFVQGHIYDHYIYAALAVVGTLLGSLFTQWVLTRSRWAVWFGTLRGVVPPFINVIGVLFSLTLVFLANDTWSAHDRALRAVHKEADALRSLKVLAEHLPVPHAERVRDRADAYGWASAQEWPLLAQRRYSSEVTRRADLLMSQIANPEISYTTDATLREMLLRQAAAAREQREERITLSQTHVNPLKWLGMAFLGFVTMLSVAAVHIGHPRAMALSLSLYALAAAPAAAIVLVQGNPFQQPTTVTPGPLMAVVESP
ncbi:MAG: DUF4239 domain-containing protein [Pseudomonadota bacterium]|nr:DUF4239 domain-containing protein [Pseudomonadota bacterium]